MLCGKSTDQLAALAKTGDDPSRILLPLMMRYNFSPGEVSGRVIDAANGRGLAGVSLCSSPEECIVTNPDGSYTAITFPGDRELTASLTGYYPVIKPVYVIGADTVELNYALSSNISGGNIELRAVFTWDSTPFWPPDQVENDLDAHLWLDTILPVHIFYDNRGDCTTYPNACLETDFRRGFGPETLAIRQLEPDTIYYFGILNYNQGANGVPHIKDTGAHVDVYDASGVVASYDAASSQGNGNFWYIFTYSYSSQQGSWVLTPKNCIAYYNSDIQSIISHCP